MTTTRLTDTRRLIVTGQFSQSGPADIEVEISPDKIRWRFVGERRFREMPWNMFIAGLDSLVESDKRFNTLRRRRLP